MTEFTMPSLGSDMDAGTLVEWRVAVGDRVSRGDIVALVETQKATMEVEIFTTGVIDSLCIEPGEKVPVGTVLATIREEGEPAVKTAVQTAEISTSDAPAATRRLRISPAARRRAMELDVDPAAVVGTGRGGAITLADIDKASVGGPQAQAQAQAPPARTQAPPAQTQAPPSAAPEQSGKRELRKAIAAVMERSNREVPHYYLSTTIAMARATNYLRDYNAERPPEKRVLVGALLLRAVVVALEKVPELNGHWIDGALRPSESIHLATAISLRGGGVIAPALRDAQTLSLDELMHRLRDLVARARALRLRSSESDGTITVTSLGERGPEAVFGVIYPPQVALIGFGSVVERPWAIDGALIAQPVVTASLAGDHRATDGHRGGLFLRALDRALQEPEGL